MTITKREAALRELQKLVGVHEVGWNNRGPMVDRIERADSLGGIGYSWCQSTQNYAWLKANGEKLADGTASVYFFIQWARAKGYMVTRPRRGDHVTYNFGEGSGGPYDHVGQVERVLSLGPVLVLQTIEGNTSNDSKGSQSDGGGVYRKRRVVKASSVAFVRVPGNCPHPERYVKKSPYELWRDWYLGRRDKAHRPKRAPRRISAAWWAHLRADLKKRKK